MNRVIVCILAVLTCVPLFPQKVNEAIVKQQINSVASSLRTLQCDFVQTKHLKMLNDKMVSRGKMYYSKDNRLRWEYVTPYKYVFVLNGNKVLLKNNGRKDIIDVKKNKMFSEIARIMMNSVVGKCLNDENDFKSRITGTQTEWIAQLTPLRKDMKQMFQKINLHFSKSASMVTVVELIEKNGDKTVIELKNIKTNVAFSEDIFAVN